MFKIITLIAALLLSATVISADPVLAGGWSWTDSDGLLHEYGIISDAGRSWNDAVDQVVDGWYLATVTSIEEQNSLIFGLGGYSGEYWLGGYQTGTGNDPENDWAWVTNETWEYKNWAPGEPNDYFGQGSEQHLAAWSRWGESAWLWNDEACLAHISGYVVERTQSVPEPGTVILFAIGLVAILMLPKKRYRNNSVW